MRAAQAGGPPPAWGARARSFAALARWLGPWADGLVPSGVARRDELLATPRGPMEVAWFSPERRAPRRATLVAQGLHFAGVNDPRLDRFCRVLARAGHLVLCPRLPDYLALQVAPTVTDDLAVAFDALEARAREAGLGRPSLFSISFGSLPVLTLAARASHAGRIERVTLFGGYADFDATIRFALTGRARDGERSVELPRDPLNSPVVLLHALDVLPPEANRTLLAEAMRDSARRTWGKPELKHGDARAPHVEAAARGLGPLERHLLLLSACLPAGPAPLPGLPTSAEAWLEAQLRDRPEAYRFADPRPHLARIQAPVAVAHGLGDDVIPWLEAEKLDRGLPRSTARRLFLTGAFSHTGSARPPLSAAYSEARSLAALLATLA